MPQQNRATDTAHKRSTFSQTIARPSPHCQGGGGRLTLLWYKICTRVIRPSADGRHWVPPSGLAELGAHQQATEANVDDLQDVLA